MPQFDIVRREAREPMDDGLELYRYEWSPAKPKAQILLLHGVAEHALRYEHVAQYFANRGYRVVAFDQRGHGATGLRQHGGDRTKLGKLGAGGVRRARRDLEAVLRQMRAEHRDLKLGLIAHSWGSLTAQSLLNQDATLADAFALTGTAWRRVRHMRGGDLNKRHAHLGDTGGEWLSRDENMVQAWVDDPLAFEAKVPELFGYVETAKLLGRPGKNINRDVPVLIASGSDDSLCRPSSLKKLGDEYKVRSGLSDVTVKIFPGARHEIFYETNRETVMEYIDDWMRARLIK